MMGNIKVFAVCDGRYRRELYWDCLKKTRGLGPPESRDVKRSEDTTWRVLWYGVLCCMSVSVAFIIVSLRYCAVVKCMCVDRRTISCGLMCVVGPCGWSCCGGLEMSAMFRVVSLRWGVGKGWVVWGFCCCVMLFVCL